MLTVRGKVKNGKIELSEPMPATWNDGTEVELNAPALRGFESVPDNNRPLSPKQIAQILEDMEAIQGPWLEPEAYEAWQNARAEQKAWELANWDKHSKEIEDLFK